MIFAFRDLAISPHNGVNTEHVWYGPTKLGWSLQ